MSLILPPPPPPSSNKHKHNQAAFRCPRCGERLTRTGGDAVGAEEEAQKRRIAELEGQIRFLTGKATAAVDKLADYEDELRRLRGLHRVAGGNHQTKNKNDDSYDYAVVNSSSTTTLTSSQQNDKPVPAPAAQQPLSPTSPSTTAAAPTTLPVQTQVQSRFSSFLLRSTSNSSSSNKPPQTSTPFTNNDLQAALCREQALRQEAEGRLSQANGELEELSAQLFQQANEMVAVERKARARLEERVAMLERRDGEKRKRLERLEGAVARIERVRGLLGRSGGGGGG